MAIARALVNEPALLLADEPTGDLDERSAEGIFELMQRLHQSHHLTSILATHNLTFGAAHGPCSSPGTRETGSGRRSARRCRGSCGATGEHWGRTPGERG